MLNETREITRVKKKILVVDDDLDLLEQITAMLTAAGYDVTAAEGQAGGEEAILKVKPDLAVLDLMMEEKDSGFVLSHQFKKLYPEMPVILLTAVSGATGLSFLARHADERSWIKVDKIMDKPVRAEQLKAEVRKLLDEEPEHTSTPGINGATMQTACFVQTIKERCRVCYTCVRECPAKAIGISDGQANVIPERCIGCGNCARVCSQGAKKVLDGTQQVKHLLNQGGAVAALMAPSFPAEFEECEYEKVVGMLRALGFRYVHEVGFAADLVARRYRELLDSPDRTNYIATTCPALVGYVERYYPDLVPKLAPIVSPMVAAARIVHRLYGPEVPVVFIGPCIAKKGEAASEKLEGEVDAVLTFARAPPDVGRSRYPSRNR